MRPEPPLSLLRDLRRAIGHLRNVFAHCREKWLLNDKGGRERNVFETLAQQKLRKEQRDVDPGPPAEAEGFAEVLRRETSGIGAGRRNSLSCWNVKF